MDQQKLDLLLEAERRNILPENKKQLLAEARTRGLVPPIKQEEESFLGNLGSGLMGAVQSAKGGFDFLAGGLARTLGAEEDSDKLFSMAEKNIREAETKNKGGVGGTIGTLAGGALTFPVQAPAAALRRQVNVLDKGGSYKAAQNAAMADLALNTAASMLPGGGSNAGVAAIRGAYGNLLADLGSDVYAARTLKQEGNEEAGSQFRSPQEYAMSALIGAGGGYIPTKISNVLAQGNQAKIRAAIESGDYDKFREALPMKQRAKAKEMWDIVKPQPKKAPEVPLNEAVNVPADDLISGDIRNPYSLEGDWRVDELGMPIRQDLSEEIATTGDTGLFGEMNRQQMETPLGAGGRESRMNPADITAPELELMQGGGRRPLQDLYTNDALPFTTDPLQTEMRLPDRQSGIDVLPYNTKEQAEVMAGLRNQLTDNTTPKGTQGDLFGMQRGSWTPFAGVDEEISISAPKMPRPTNANEYHQRVLESFEDTVKLKDGTEVTIVAQPHPSGRKDQALIQAVDKNGQAIGVLGTGFDPTGNRNIADVSVLDAWQRKGVATALYNKAEELAGAKLRPSDNTSDAAKGFWRSRQQEGSWKPFKQETWKSNEEASKYINDMSKKQWVGKAISDLGYNHVIADALYNKIKNDSSLSNPVPTQQAGTGPVASLGKDAGVSVNDVPWQNIKEQVITSGIPDIPRKLVGAVQSRQVAQAKGGVIKWGIDQILLSRGLWRQAIRDKVFGQQVTYDNRVIRGLPKIIQNEDAPLPFYKNLTKAERDGLATVMAELDKANLGARVSDMELKNRGLDDKQVQAFNKLQEMFDFFWESRAKLLTELGRQDEIGSRRANYLPQKRNGNFTRAVYGPNGELIGYFDYQSKADAKKAVSDINAVLIKEGIDPSQVVIGSPMSIQDKFTFSPIERYFDRTGLSRGTGTKGYFEEKKGVLGGAGTGLNPGKEVLNALDTYAVRMEKFLAGLEARKRLEPLWNDKDMVTNYKNSLDYITREYDAMRGNAAEQSKLGTSRAFDETVRQYLGETPMKYMQMANTMFNYSKVTLGNPVSYAYNSIVQPLLSGPARASFLQGRTGADTSIGMSFGKSLYQITTNTLPTDQRSALKWLAEQGLMDQSTSKAILNFGTDETRRGRVVQAMESAVDRITLPEHFGRAYTFLAFDNLLKKAIPDTQKRWKTAADHMTQAMVDMSPEGRLLMTKEGSQIFAQAYGPLKSFVHNDLAQMMLYVKEAKVNPKPLAMYLVSRLAVGGLSSAVLVKEYDALAALLSETFGLDVPESEELFKDLPEMSFEGIPTGEMLYYGTPSVATGLDIRSAGGSSSVADYPWFPSISMSKQMLESLATIPKDTELGMYKAAKAVGPTISGRLMDEWYSDVVANREQKAGRDLPEGKMLYNSKGEATVPASVQTTASKATGKKSMEQVKQETEQRIATKAETRFKELRKKGYDRLYRAWKSDENGDGKEVQAVVRDLAELHVKYKQELTDDAIERAIEERYKKEVMSQKTRRMTNESKAGIQMYVEGE